MASKITKNVSGNQIWKSVFLSNFQFVILHFLQHLKEKHEAAKKAKEEAEAEAKKASEAIAKAIMSGPTRSVSLLS